MAMNGLAKMAAIALLMVMAIVPAAVAVTYTVGGSDQWSTGVDYTKWVIGKTFTVGDVLEFKYGSSHSVDEVDQAGYDNCGGKPIVSQSDGDTKITLDTVGPKYFICPTPGHCQRGMKLAVTVVAASTPGTPSTPPAPGTPTTPGSGSTSSPPPKPSGASKGVMSYVLVGASMVLGYGLYM